MTSQKTKLLFVQVGSNGALPEKISFAFGVERLGWLIPPKEDDILKSQSAPSSVINKPSSVLNNHTIVTGDRRDHHNFPSSLLSSAVNE